MNANLNSCNPVRRLVASAIVAAAGLVAPAAAGPIGVAIVGNQIYTLNENGSLTSGTTVAYQSYSGIGYIGLATFGSTYRAVSRVNAYSNFYPQQVFSINRTTGVAGLLNNTNSNFFQEGDCATDPSTGDLWAVKPGGQLYRFVANAYNSGTLIGTIPGILDASAMAFDPSGNLWVLDFNSNGRLLNIDKTNASVLAIKPVTGVQLFPGDGGMFFNPSNAGQVIVSCQGVSGNFSGPLLTKISTASGAASVMGQMSAYPQGIVVTSGVSTGSGVWWHGILLEIALVEVNFNGYNDTQLVAAQSLWQIDTTAMTTAQDARVVVGPADPVRPPTRAASIDPGTAIAQVGTFEHGQWTFTTDLYVPSCCPPPVPAAAGISLLGEMDLSTGARAEATTLTIDAMNGILVSSMGTALPLQRDRWTTIRVEVDLDTATQSAFYDDVTLYQNMPWPGGGTPGSNAAIKGLSFWNQGGPAYLIDNVRLNPAGATPRCVADVDDGSGTGTPDGGVGIEDLIQYLISYDAGSAAADIDDGSGTGVSDGGVGIEDLLFYLARYDAGC